MAYYSDIDSYRCDSFDQDVKEWSEGIDILPWQIGPPVHQQRSFNSYHALDQAHPCHLPSNSTPPDFYLMSQETSPPYYSSPSTLYDGSSSSSSRPSPPVDSPASSFLRTPELYHRDVLIPPLGMNSYTLELDHGMYATGSCVAMQNVQRCADAHFEETIDDFGIYETAYEPQELVPAALGEDGSPSSTPYYHHHRQIPLANAESSQNNVEPYPKIEPEAEPKQTRFIRQSHRHRRVAEKQTPLLTTRSSRVTKRSSTPREATTSRARTQNQRIKEEDDEHKAQPSLRSFPCPLAPYGCTSSFSAKNEWKRHAATQHFRLGFWRCDLCPPETKTLNSHKTNNNNNNNSNTRTPKPSSSSTTTHNDFNRKDLFIQHVRRMHPDSISLATTTSTTSKPNKKTTSSTRKRPSSTSIPTAKLTTSLSHLATRCHRLAHSLPPPSLCVFCNERFEGGAEGLESRLEHMGKHMDSRRKEGKEPVEVEEWKRDEGLEGWLEGCGVLVRERYGGLVVKGS
jgi:hypothetical protein